MCLYGAHDDWIPFVERQREIERIGKLIDDLITWHEEDIRMATHLNTKKYEAETIDANARPDNMVRVRAIDEYGFEQNFNGGSIIYRTIIELNVVVFCLFFFIFLCCAFFLANHTTQIN